jgi:hypothetical protein
MTHPFEYNFDPCRLHEYDAAGLYNSSRQCSWHSVLYATHWVLRMRHVAFNAPSNTTDSGRALFSKECTINSIHFVSFIWHTA